MFGSMSPLHWLLVLAVVLLLFGGRGKVSDLMGDFAKGIKSFKKGLADEDTPVATTTPVSPTVDRRIEPSPVSTPVHPEKTNVG